MKNSSLFIMKKKFRLISTKAFQFINLPFIFALICLICFGESYAQNQISQNETEITGKVTNTEGSPLPGANIVIKGTSIGIITDQDGDYSIKVSGQESILEFSSIGFMKEEVIVGAKTTIDIVLSEDLTALEEVILIGYSTQKKRDKTGSIVSVSSEELMKSGKGNLGTAIQGRAAGVYAVANNGKPGTGMSIRIRGAGGVNASEPLYVIDGIQGANASQIDPNDVESIEVLKDAASAAIYGARGANGVVLITTKRGRAGKAKVSYSGSFGVQNMINVGNVEGLNAQQYATTINKGYAAAGEDIPFGGTNTEQYPVEHFPSPDQLGVGTNWMDVMTRSNAPIQNHQLAISGGNEKHLVYLSLGYLDQEGVYLNTDYKRFSFRVNTDNKIYDWLKIGNSTSFSQDVQNGAASDNQYGDLWLTFVTPPTIPVYNKDGSLAGPPSPFYRPDRTPYATNANTMEANKGNILNNNVYAEFTTKVGLSFKTSVSNSVIYSEGDKYMNRIYSEGMLNGNETELTIGKEHQNAWIWSNVLSYNKSLGDHNISALAGYEAQHLESTYTSGYAKYDDPSYKVVGNNGSFASSINNGYVERSLVSQFGNVAYNYKSKYYVSGNIRRDGSSRFGENNRYAIFPSASAAWRLSGEDFFPTDLINDLKFRGSYGEVGNDNIGDYRNLAPLNSVQYSMTGQNGSFENGLGVSSIGNPDLKWETSKQLSVGIDMAFIRNKLSFSADYYKTDISDMLLGATIPTTSGIPYGTWGSYPSTIINAGSITNTGYEFELSFKNNSGEFFYGINANLTTMNNTITDIGGNEYLEGGNGINRSYEDGSLADFYGYVCEGIFQTQAEIDAANALGDPALPYQYAETAPGDFKYKDLNDDNVINDDDREIIGSSIPKLIYGFSFDLNYKQFSLSALFYGVHGNKVYNSLRSELESTGGVQNKSTSVLDAWNGVGTSSTIPRRYTMDLNQNARTSTAYLEDGSFLRLQNIMLSYKLPFDALNANGRSASVYISGDNLLTFTKYKGFNPEVSISNGGNMNSGVDHAFYPHASIIRLGLNISF